MSRRSLRAMDGSEYVSTVAGELTDPLPITIATLA